MVCPLACIQVWDVRKAQLWPTSCHLSFANGTAPDIVHHPNTFSSDGSGYGRLCAVQASLPAVQGVCAELIQMPEAATQMHWENCRFRISFAGLFVSRKKKMSHFRTASGYTFVAQDGSVKASWDPCQSRTLSSVTSRLWWAVSAGMFATMPIF